MSKLGPPIKTSIACQCDTEGCQLSMTFDHVVDDCDLKIRLWTYGGRPDGQALFILGDRERLCMAWMLLIPSKPVPHDLSDRDLREALIMELLESIVYVEKTTIADCIKQYFVVNESENYITSTLRNLNKQE